MLISDQERSSALGTFTNQQEKAFYSQLCTLFRPMNKPEPGDWLHSHKEAHQSFNNYSLPNYNPVSPERKTIYLQQFGAFNKAFIQQLCHFCSVFYPKLLVKTLPILQFQNQLAGIKKRQNYHGSNQYLAQDILAYMQKRVPKDAYCVMGVTLKDIYPGDSWNYVYGWAKYKARVGIFSFVRWDDQFASGNTQEIDWKLILYPSMRTMVHQIGHMFGITHCVYNRCLMNGFNCIEENYINPLQFCPICYRKIAKNIGFSHAQRHKNLIAYCQKSEVKELKKDQLLYEQLVKVDKKYKFESQVNEPTIKQTMSVPKPAKPLLSQKPNIKQNTTSTKPIQTLIKPNAIVPKPKQITSNQNPKAIQNFAIAKQNIIGMAQNMAQLNLDIPTTSLTTGNSNSKNFAANRGNSLNAGTRK